jgi:hypothetical protein
VRPRLVRVRVCEADGGAKVRRCEGAKVRWCALVRFMRRGSGPSRQPGGARLAFMPRGTGTHLVCARDALVHALHARIRTCRTGPDSARGAVSATPGPSAAVDLPRLTTDVVAHPATVHAAGGRPAPSRTAAPRQSRIRARAVACAVASVTGGGHRGQLFPCRRAGWAPAATRSATAVFGSLPTTSDSPTSTASAPSLA